MADNATTTFDSGLPAEGDRSPLGEPIDFDVRGLGRRLLGTDAPEGWIKKIERRREGKVWVGFFHLWSTDANGRRVRQKKEKTLGPASMPKHKAQSELAEYIEEYRQDHKTRRLDQHLCGSVEHVLRREVREVVEEDEGGPPLPFCEARSSGRGEPTAA